MTTESTEAIPSAAPPRPVDIPAVVAGLRKTFATGRTRSVEWRRTQLRALEQMIADNEPPIAEALATDLGRKPFEAWLADIASTAGEARDAAKNVGKWTKREHRLLEMSQLPGPGWIEYEPYGTVLIIGAWNFPFALTLGPLVGAIAAGNTVVLKPSELAPASSAADGRAGAAVPRLRGDRGDRGRRRGQPGTHRAGLRQAVLHRRHRDRPQGLRERRAAPDAGHPGTGRQEPGDRGSRRRRRRRRQAHRLDQADELRPDLHRAGLRAGRCVDPRRARDQDRRRDQHVRGRATPVGCGSSTSGTSIG